jgi:predicted anti-sigma-YlaC factor YlaD
MEHVAMNHKPTDLDCADAIEAISAHADGEQSPVADTRLARHLIGCASCREFESETALGRRSSILGPAPEIPDLSVSVTRANANAERRNGWSLTRILLALVALSVIGLSVPGLLLGEDGAAPSHEARHLGAFSMAYGIALLVIVYRPSRARAFLLVTLVLAMALLITAVADVLVGHIPLVGELIHIPELLSVLLVWDLARRQSLGPIAGAPGAGDEPRAPALRIIEGQDLPQ